MNDKIPLFVWFVCLLLFWLAGDKFSSVLAKLGSRLLFVFLLGKYEI